MGSATGGLAKRYLTTAHRDDLSTSCGFATLGSDAAHASPSFRACYERELRNHWPRSAKGHGREEHKKDTDDSLDDAIALMTICVGGMSLARAVVDPKLSARILRVAETPRPNSPTPNRIKENVMAGAKPYGQLQYREINGKRMAYVDEGQGDAIVFQHGNPTSSYLWRNIMPHLEGLGRLVACDLIGMGDSDKLDDSGPDRYHYAEQRDYLFGCGTSSNSAIASFSFCTTGVRHSASTGPTSTATASPVSHTWKPLRCRSIGPTFPGPVSGVFQGFRSPKGESMVLEQNLFVEAVLPGAINRKLTDEEMDHYREPFRTPGEDRRPTLSWPRNIPIEGEPADVVAIVEEYGAWLAQCDVPKLFVNAEPGAITRGRVRDFVRTWPNQTEVTVPGTHFIQEDSADEIGAALASFVRAVRATG